MTNDFIGCWQLNHAETKVIRQFHHLEANQQIDDDRLLDLNPVTPDHWCWEIARIDNSCAR
jgi:hypothetical protein